MGASSTQLQYVAEPVRSRSRGSTGSTRVSAIFIFTSYSCFLEFAKLDFR